MSKIIIIDAGKCLGCRTCEIQCAVAHSRSKKLIEAVKETPVPLSRVTVEENEGLCIPLHCHHCEDAPCLGICPTHAIERLDENGPVLLNKKKCIGCKMCILVCPFGVLKMDKNNKAVIKCDLCIERLEEGKDPACVDACPTKAMKFVEIKNASKEKRKKYLVQLRGEIGGQK